MDRLWSPWRLEYVARGGSDTGCIFCEASGSSGSSSLVVFKGTLCYVILNLYPYNNGHLMVVPIVISRRSARSRTRKSMKSAF